MDEIHTTIRSEGQREHLETLESTSGRRKMPNGWRTVCPCHISTYQLYDSVTLFPLFGRFFFSEQRKKSSVENYEILLHTNLIKCPATVN